MMTSNNIWIIPNYKVFFINFQKTWGIHCYILHWVFLCEVGKAEKSALDKDCIKESQKEILCKQNIAAQCNYVDALTYIDMYYFPASWWMVVVHWEFGKLISETAKRDALKQQIKVWVIGFEYVDFTSLVQVWSLLFYWGITWSFDWQYHSNTNYLVHSKFTTSKLHVAIGRCWTKRQKMWSS